ncbi:hypothetical protein VN21_04585 [Paraclostridium benzoelyticum]|uniref:Glycosyl transferase family 28 C-terminal domain-containing protein n=1 Tax=Paraclostridium benzoelyticum TaxID=1629550 RepID=A0A0M3DL58_9FIRM|nr:PssE/Cps14G family polysaccharide biosynthesis glycosyltransferase [Paraclostridium benzoelyticum]KKY02174.1 hypothetical protein VN21_04585 [Paraclostridium benzoelyticum]
MIYVTVGTQKFNFDRLLLYIDKAIDKGYISSEVYAQIGYCTYKPKNYNYEKFIDKQTIETLIDKSEFVISHGGSGNIIENLKKKKKIIVIPRDVDFEEHVDNHQFELVNKFAELGLIMVANDEKTFFESLKKIEQFRPSDIDKYLDHCELLVKIIDKFIYNKFKHL